MDEVTTCRMYLDREFAFLKPKIIGLLGRTAYSTSLVEMDLVPTAVEF